MPALTFDTGALIAIERVDRQVLLDIKAAERADDPILVPSIVVAQAWRGGPRGARVAAFLKRRSVTIIDVDILLAKAAGRLCGETDTTDLVDAVVAVVAARHNTAIVTSDPDDLRRISPARLISC